MLRVEGNARVTQLEDVSQNLITGTVYVSEKVKGLKDKYITTFLNAKFVGQALEYLVSNCVENKDKLYIKSAIIRTDEYTNNKGKTYRNLELMVFEIEDYHEYEPKEEKKASRGRRTTKK